MTHERSLYAKGKKDDWPPNKVDVFIIVFFYGHIKRGSPATNYRGEEFDSFRLISPQTTRILSIYAKSRHFGAMTYAAMLTVPA